MKKIRIFTDGACSGNPGPGGWGLIINTQISIKQYSGGEENTTNNRMELLAVVKALSKIAKFAGKNKYEFNIYSDSAYVVNAINNGWVDTWTTQGWKTTKGNDIKNQDLWKAFIKISKVLHKNNVDYSIIKVKGHAGNTFNEIVDKLAKSEVDKIKEALR